MAYGAVSIELESIMEAYNPVQDFAATQETARTHAILTRLLIWTIVCTIFISWGGYLVWTSMAIGYLLAGILLLFCAVVAAFLMICEIIDLCF